MALRTVTKTNKANYDSHGITTLEEKQHEPLPNYDK